MSDYSAPTPVWAPADLGGFVLTREHLDDLGVDETLRTGLLGWQAFFDEHHPAELCGWDSPVSCTRYAVEGQRLQRALAAALPHVVVDLDLWPVPPCDHEVDAVVAAAPLFDHSGFDRPPRRARELVR